MAIKNEFSDAELLRYSRHILLPQLDVSGQLAISNSRVLIVGLGGLGSPVAQYLAASGVGQLVLTDFDCVELSNLQRQVIHTQDRIGLNKAESAAVAIRELNDRVDVTVIPSALADEQLLETVNCVDVVVDCSDNFLTRRQINRACFLARKPLVSGAAIRMEGQLSVFDFRKKNGPCYECLFPDLSGENLTCSESGVLSPVVGVIGCMQVVEVLKLLANMGEDPTGKIHLYDALAGQWRELRFRKDTQCACCGQG